MLKSSDEEVIGQFKNGVDSAVRALKADTQATHEIWQETSEVFADAATKIGKLSEKMGSKTFDVANDAARIAKLEANRHPGATFAAAIAAAVAVLGLVALSRRGRKSPDLGNVSPGEKGASS